MMLRTRVVGAVLVVALIAALPAGSAQAVPANPAQLIGNYAVAIADHQHPARVVTAQDVSDALQAVQSLSASNLGMGFNLGTLPDFPNTVEVTNSVTYEQECLEFPKVIGALPHVARCSPLVILTWESSIGYVQGALGLVAKEAQHGQAVSGAEVARARIGSLAVMPTFLAGEGGIARFIDTAKVSTKKVTATICIYFSKWAYVSPKLEAC